MSYTELRFLPFIVRLREHFHQQRYSFGVTQNYPVAVRRFLRDLERPDRRVESVSPAEVESYLDTLRIGRGRSFPKHSRRMHRAAIHMMLRLIRSEWPPAAMPTDVREASSWQRHMFSMQHCTGYDPWFVVSGPTHRLRLVELWQERPIGHDRHGADDRRRRCCRNRVNAVEAAMQWDSQFRATLHCLGHAETRASARRPGKVRGRRCRQGRTGFPRSSKFWLNLPTEPMRIASDRKILSHLAALGAAACRGP
jgi:hypothetical protein